MKKWIAFKCGACGHEEKAQLPLWFRAAAHTCSKCSRTSRLRPRVVVAALLGLIGPAVAWIAYVLAYPKLPPYLAMLVAAVIVVFPALFFRPKLVEWTAFWAID
jgi:hypothetical protein